MATESSHWPPVSLRRDDVTPRRPCRTQQPVLILSQKELGTARHTRRRYPLVDINERVATTTTILLLFSPLSFFFSFLTFGRHERGKCAHRVAGVCACACGITMMQSAAVLPTESPVKSLPDILGVPLQRKDTGGSCLCRDTFKKKKKIIMIRLGVECRTRYHILAALGAFLLFPCSARNDICIDIHSYWFGVFFA